MTQVTQHFPLRSRLKPSPDDAPGASLNGHHDRSYHYFSALLQQTSPADSGPFQTDHVSVRSSSAGSDRPELPDGHRDCDLLLYLEPPSLPSDDLNDPYRLLHQSSFLVQYPIFYSCDSSCSVYH